MHVQRGQTLPVWLFGILTSLMLMLLVFNYANSVRWQIRAQNAADAVAQSIMSVQSTHYNKVLMNLHAAAIEEWRIRRTMNALLMVMQGMGGCDNDGRTCDQVYDSLRANYIADVARYTVDVQRMASLTAYTYADQQADMKTIAAAYQNNCSGTGPTGGDCAFTYTVANPQARCGVSGVLNDAGGTTVGAGVAVPGGFNCATSDLSPLEVEVVACAQVSPIVQHFFNFNMAPTYAIGRAAATSAMVTQEWFNPGVLTNPGTGAAFQAPEFPEDASNIAPTGCTATCYNTSHFCDATNPGYDWYAVHWCSNAWAAEFTHSGAPDGFESLGIDQDEYSVWTGWWSALPISPYNGTFRPTSGTCQAKPWNS